MYSYIISVWTWVGVPIDVMTLNCKRRKCWHAKKRSCACIEYNNMMTSLTKASTPIENGHSTACLISRSWWKVSLFFAHVYGFATLYSYITSHTCDRFQQFIVHTSTMFVEIVRLENLWKKNVKVAIRNRL